jgi:hypothetical protein
MAAFGSPFSPLGRTRWSRARFCAMIALETAGEGTMEINNPDILAEVRAVFGRYEAAIAANDSAVLDSSFWEDPRVVRYGIEAIRAFRASVKSYAPRAQKKITITSFGRDFATTNLEFQRLDSGLVGRETKIMARIPGQGWRIVSAHVSLLAQSDPGRVAKG